MANGQYLRSFGVGKSPCDWLELARGSWWPGLARNGGYWPIAVVCRQPDILAILNDEIAQPVR